MTRKVITIGAKQTVLEACNAYRDYKVGCLIVTDDDCCVGILTERDIIERTICQHRDPEKTLVNEIMSSDTKTIHALDTLDKATEVMIKNKIKKLPVVVNERIVGIITVTDISKARLDLSRRVNDSLAKTVWMD